MNSLASRIQDPNEIESVMRIPQPLNASSKNHAGGLINTGTAWHGSLLALDWRQSLVGVCLALVMLACFLLPAASARADISAQQVEGSIERGVNYLRSQQRKNGAWDFAGFRVGATSLATLSLLNAGVPEDDADIKRALQYIRTHESESVYGRSLQTLVYCHVGSAADLTRIQSNVKWLQQAQRPKGSDGTKGGWGYHLTGGGSDPSNTQFAILALGAAEDRGVTVDSDAFLNGKKYWESRQRNNGGWSYNGLDISGSMTCAGIASIVICRGHLDGIESSIDGDTIQCCGGQEDAGDPVEKGLGWLARNFSATENPGVGSMAIFYYVYALERVGRMTGRRLIGTHDWYREGAESLIRLQDDLNGNWRGTQFGESSSVVSTSLALLFLSKGKRQVLLGRLNYKRDTDDRGTMDRFQQWSRHWNGPRQLTRHVERQWGRDLTWQTFDLYRSRVEDLMQSPVLIITGKDQLQLAQQQSDLLKDYIEQGGTLLFDAQGGDGCGDATAFRDDVQSLCNGWFQPGCQNRLCRLLQPAPAT
ncbi:MAG: DUF4159 domain-containing protein, partial [Planctomycetota bacterium]